MQDAPNSGMRRRAISCPKTMSLAACSLCRYGRFVALGHGHIHVTTAAAGSISAASARQRPSFRQIRQPLRWQQESWPPPRTVCASCSQRTLAGASSIFTSNTDIHRRNDASKRSDTLSLQSCRRSSALPCRSEFHRRRVAQIRNCAQEGTWQLEYVQSPDNTGKDCYRKLPWTSPVWSLPHCRGDSHALACPHRYNTLCYGAQTWEHLAK